MYQLKHFKFHLLLLSMLFVTGWQQVKAEDEKARLMIPSADATSDTYTFSSSVTPLRPYFTVYLWYRNTEHTDAYWVDEPKLYLDSDKNALKLEGIKGSDDLGDIDKFLTCKVDGKDVFYVRYRGSFKSTDNFIALFKNFKQQNDTWKDDYYVTIDIMPVENKVSQPHTVWVKGKAKLDNGTGDVTAYSPEGYSTVKTENTLSPFGVTANYGSVEWTNPGKLTYTTPSYSANSKITEGRFQPIIDGVYGNIGASGKLTATKDYGSDAKYNDTIPTPIGQRFYDQFDLYDTERTKSPKLLRLSFLRNGSFLCYTDDSGKRFGMLSSYLSEGVTNLLSDGISMTPSHYVYTGGGTLYCEENTTFTFENSNYHFTSIKMKTNNGSVCGSWSGSATNKCSVDVGMGYNVYSIEFQFEEYIDGHQVTFYDDGKKASVALPTINKLTVESKDAWNKKINLSWDFDSPYDDITGKSTDSILIYRDNVIVDNLKGSTKSWSDANVDYDKKYSYSVGYQPKGWTDNSLTKGLYSSIDATLNHDFQISQFTVDPAKSGYKLNWEATKIPSSYITSSTQFIITRFTYDGNGQLVSTDKVAAVDASATSTKYTYTDEYVTSNTNYEYKISIDVQETTCETLSTKPSGTLEGITITNLRATRGTYGDRVELNWTASTVTKSDYIDYYVYRHAINNSGLQQYQQPGAWTLLDSLKNNQDNVVSYTDKHAVCGVYYMYKVVGRPNNGGNTFELKCDGFARNTAVLDGTITYSSGSGSSAVEGVRVELEPGKDSDFKLSSLYFSNSTGGLVWMKDAVSFTNYFDQSAYSMQLYLRPEKGLENACLLDMRGTLQLTLCDENEEGYRIAAKVGENDNVIYKSSERVAPCEFTNVTFAYDGKGTSVLYLVKSQTLGQVVTDTLMSGVPINWQPKENYTARIAVCSDADTLNTLRGYVDEVRFFTRQLKADDVLKYYDRTMSGNEDNLVAYWSMDETADSLFHAYDYSSTDGIANENHAFVIHGCRTHDIVPTRDQLSMHTLTNENGYYYIQGIPFTGVNGTAYRIIPSKGVHSFDKPEESITASSTSSKFTRDFKDVSSFSVKGVVYYENTTYPVKDCYFYVDNVLQKDEHGTITSNSEGEFRLSVGIGRHVIRVAHKDHTFKYDGFYPAEGDREYNDSVSHLTFTDVTKTIVAGRVVGGAVERNKPLGFGQSAANIGAATLTLLTSTDAANARSMNMVLDEDEGIFSQNTDTLFYETLGTDSCVAYVGGSKDGGNAVKTITIKTNPVSGEFAVKLPPVPYYVSTIVDHNEQASTALSTLQLLDASNVAKVDSSVVTTDEGTQTFQYNVSFLPTYYTVPQIEVVQPDNYLGAFGEARVPAGELGDSVEVYHTDPTTGELVYNYGHPIFMGWQHYQFDISSFERYYNYDADPENPVNYDYPSSEGRLTFKNPMDLTADTLENVPLDAEGKYSYQFSALEPNLVAPYLQPINISMALGDNNYEWAWNYNGEQTLQGVVFSAKQTGNASVTKAPDTVDMVLRDPFGTDSYTTWNTGYTYSNGFKRSSTWKFSAKKEKDKGDALTLKKAVGAPGAYLFQMAEGGYERTKLSDYNLSFENAQNFSWTITRKQEVSTSSAKRYDGPDGDVFVGHSSTISFGEGQEVKLIDQQNGQYAIGVEDVMVTGEQIESDFAYAQYDIINTVIPNFKKLRDQRLLKVSLDSLVSMRANYHNMTDSIIYATHLRPDDPNFGTDNDDDVWGDDGYLTWRSDSLCAWGPSYTLFIPEGSTKDDYQWDAIVDANSDISNWEFLLAENERMKVEAFRDPDKYFKNAYSITAGADVSFDEEKDKSWELDVNIEFSFHKTRKFALAISKDNIQEKKRTVGLELEWGDERKPGYFHTGDSDKAFHYVLADHDLDNSHDISVYKAPDNYSFIFRQTGGVTSCPYEGEKVAKYYEPEERHVISEPTTQLEVPHIYCPDPVKTGVPAGEPATFLLKLTNATTATPENSIEFGLQVVSDKYAAMASVGFNGPGQAEGNIYPVTLMDKQDSAIVRLDVMPIKGVIDIDSLHICFYPVGQLTISDDLYLSAHFQPTAEKVELAVDKTVVNTVTGPQLHLTAKGYDPASSILNAVRLQQAKKGSDVWTTLRSYVAKPNGDTESLLRNTVDTLIDMSSSIVYPDGTYKYRAITDCTVSGVAAEGSSQVIEVIKDLTLPKPIQLPSPSDGVLSPGDNISITFNEDIENEALNKADNFVIQAVLNDNVVAHEVALRMDGQEKAVAQTQSQLTLGGTSFTICLWVKHEGTGGTLFRHGDFRMNIEDDGRLTVFINDDKQELQQYTSTTAIPQGQWSYVAAVYDNEASTLSAYYATGEQEATLFNHEYVGKGAQSQGIIYLGENLKGAMHELSMFSAALTWTTIKEQMYMGKSHSTPSIIGYWRLDEGHGTTSEDRARSRHMLLGSATSWYLESENISMNLDESTSVAIPVGQLSANALQSYLIEMWALAEPTNTADSIPLMSIDEGGKLDVKLLQDGQLHLVVNGKEQSSNYSKLKFNDGQWHHLALNVLQGATGQTNLIVDGTSVVTIASDNTPALSGGRMWLAHGMKGMIDEVRLWHGSHTQDDIVENMYYRMDPAKETQLVGYYPMEVSKYDGFAQRVDSFTTRNLAYNAYEGSDLLVGSEGVAPTPSELAPGLKSAPKKSNLDFEYASNATTVNITLSHSAASLEDCHVTTTLRNYYDKHGNIGSPVTWGFVVKQNPLMWDHTELSPAIPSGESGTFTATLTNIGDEDQNWSFTELPTWLKASPMSGTILGNGSQEITFTVLQGNPIGKYFATISARGNNNLDTPLDITLKVEGEKPDWTVVTKSSNMPLTAQLKIDGVISTDPDDMVGIFYHNECVGIGQPVYMSGRDAYYVQVLIQGDYNQAADPFEFQLYDASQGIVYPVATATPSFVFSTTAVGSLDDPVIIENDNKMLQNIHIASGWSFISTYLLPDAKGMDLFNPIADKVECIMDVNGNSAEYKDGAWTKDLSPIVPGMMFNINMKEAATLTVVGTPVDPADYPQTIKPGSNWIGVTTPYSMTVDEAFAGISPVVGDVVNDKFSFSTYTDQGWTSAIKSIEPGHGYIYTSVASEVKELVFPVNATRTASYKQSGIGANRKYAHNMMALCTVHDADGTISDDVEIKVFDQYGELRGVTVETVRDTLHLVFISGETEGEPLIIVANFNGQTFVQMLPQGFVRNGLLGRLSNPYVIGASGFTDISETIFDANSQLVVYALTGQVIFRGQASDFDRHSLSLDGIYIINETKPDGTVTCRKVRIDRY